MTAMEPKKISCSLNVCRGTSKAAPLAMAATIFNTFRIAPFSTPKTYHHPKFKSGFCQWDSWYKSSYLALLTTV